MNKQLALAPDPGTVPPARRPEWGNLTGIRDAGLRWLARADLVASAAVDRPLLAILGGGHYDLVAPWQRSAKQVWLYHPLPCFGCDWNCIHPEPKCLTAMPVDHAVRVARRLLEDRA